MKPFNKRLAYITPLVFFPPFFLWTRKEKNIISPALLIIAIVFTGCFQHYFRTNTKTSVDESTLKLLQNSNKYFVIHFVGNRVSGLNNVSVSNDELKGSPVELPDEHFKYINPRSKKPNQVDKKDKAMALLEVHLYTTDSLSNANDLSLPLSSFNRMDVYTFDKKTTTVSHILSAVGLAVPITLIVVGISIGGGVGGL